LCCIVGAEELKKFLFTVTKKGRYYVSEMEYAFGHDALMELQQTKRIENLLVDAMLFHLPCLFHPITFFISFLNA
jgi:hypothetical protein